VNPLKTRVLFDASELSPYQIRIIRAALPQETQVPVTDDRWFARPLGVLLVKGRIWLFIFLTHGSTSIFPARKRLLFRCDRPCRASARHAHPEFRTARGTRTGGINAVNGHVSSLWTPW